MDLDTETIPGNAMEQARWLDIMPKELTFLHILHKHGSIQSLTRATPSLSPLSNLHTVVQHQHPGSVKEFIPSLNTAAGQGSKQWVVFFCIAAHGEEFGRSHNGFIILLWLSLL